MIPRSASRLWLISALALAACGKSEAPLPACLDRTGPIALNRTAWSYSSRPRPELLTPVPEAPLLDTDRLGMIWYDVTDHLRCVDLLPSIAPWEYQQHFDALGIIVLPNPSAERPWAGLIQPIMENAGDLSHDQFIEIWINDMNQFHGDNAAAGAGKELRIDLGAISEDAVWDPRTPPAATNARLDTEDRDGDGRLQPAEDVGLDDAADSTEKSTGVVPDQSTYPASTANDPGGDDYGFTSPGDYSGNAGDLISRFRHINGTEKNQRIDSEDLNRNTRLDLSDLYFEYVVPLNSDSLTVEDVRRDFGISDPSNGWRLLRVPLNSGSRVGNPDLRVVRAVRLWFNGFSDTAQVQIADIRFTR